MTVNCVHQRGIVQQRVVREGGRGKRIFHGKVRSPPLCIQISHIYRASCTHPQHPIISPRLLVMAQTEILRSSILDQIRAIETNLNALNDHSRSYERGEKSLSSVGIPDHIVENALKQSKATINFLTQSVCTDLNRVKLDNLKLAEELRLNSQINFLQRKFQGILMLHHIIQSRSRRERVQNEEWQMNIDQETPTEMGISREIFFPAVVS
jgi:hypothetical protein